MVPRAQGIWFRGYRVHGFESKGYIVSMTPRVHGFESMGYIVSVVLGYRVRGT